MQVHSQDGLVQRTSNGVDTINKKTASRTKGGMILPETKVNYHFTFDPSFAKQSDQDSEKNPLMILMPCLPNLAKSFNLVLRLQPKKDGRYRSVHRLFQSKIGSNELFELFIKGLIHNEGKYYFCRR